MTHESRMDKPTLNELIELSKRNDQKSFRIIVEAHQYMVYSLAFRIMCNEEEAKDIVQETFIKVWLNLSGFDLEKKFSTWVYAITTHLCLDKLKSLKQRFKSESLNENVNILISSENADKKLIDSELGEVILSLTNELTPKQKIVFTLRYFEDLEMDEIVEITGLTPEKIKGNLYLARQAIRTKIERY